MKNLSIAFVSAHIFRGIHASRVLAIASRDRELFLSGLRCPRSALNERSFPRDAETRTRNACAPRNAIICKSWLIIAILAVVAARAFGLTPGDLSRVTFEQHSGKQIPADLTFRDENDRPFRFGDQFGKTPTILVLGYYRCPMLCMLINDGLIQALQDLRLDIGRDFQVVDVSIDPTEKPKDAAAKKLQYMKSYGRPEAAHGWNCLVGDQQSITRLADLVGFHYTYDPETRQYAHPSGAIVLTPVGKISRYIFGVKFEPREIRDAIVEAKQERSSSVISQVLLLCYHYNPITGKYGGLILSILRVASVVTLFAVVGFAVLMVRRDRRARRIALAQNSATR